MTGVELPSFGIPTGNANAAFYIIVLECHPFLNDMRKCTPIRKAHEVPQEEFGIGL